MFHPNGSAIGCGGGGDDGGGFRLFVLLVLLQDTIHAWTSSCFWVQVPHLPYSTIPCRIRSRSTLDGRIQQQDKEQKPKRQLFFHSALNTHTDPSSYHDETNLDLHDFYTTKNHTTDDDDDDENDGMENNDKGSSNNSARNVISTANENPQFNLNLVPNTNFLYASDPIERRRIRRSFFLSQLSIQQLQDLYLMQRRQYHQLLQKTVISSSLAPLRFPPSSIWISKEDMIVQILRLDEEIHNLESQALLQTSPSPPSSSSTVNSVTTKVSPLSLQSTNHVDSIEENKKKIRNASATKSWNESSFSTRTTDSSSLPLSPSSLLTPPYPSPTRPKEPPPSTTTTTTSQRKELHSNPFYLQRQRRKVRQRQWDMDRMNQDWKIQKQMKGYWNTLTKTVQHVGNELVDHFFLEEDDNEEDETRGYEGSRKERNNREILDREKQNRDDSWLFTQERQWKAQHEQQQVEQQVQQQRSKRRRTRTIEYLSEIASRRTTERNNKDQLSHPNTTCIQDEPKNFRNTVSHVCINDEVEQTTTGITSSNTSSSNETNSSLPRWKGPYLLPTKLYDAEFFPTLSQEQVEWNVNKSDEEMTVTSNSQPASSSNFSSASFSSSTGQKYPSKYPPRGKPQDRNRTGRDKTIYSMYKPSDFHKMNVTKNSDDTLPITDVPKEDWEILYGPVTSKAINNVGDFIADIAEGHIQAIIPWSRLRSDVQAGGPNTSLETNIVPEWNKSLGGQESFVSRRRYQHSNRRYWKDRLAEQLDYALGVHEDGNYTKWQDQLDREKLKSRSNDPLSIFYGKGRTGRDKLSPIRRRKKAFWEEEGDLSSLLFGRTPNGDKLTLEKFFGKQDIGVNVMTSLFRFSIKLSVLLATYICRWASCRGALPQPIVVFILFASMISAPRKRRLVTVGITMIALRTVAEVLHGYIHGNDDWHDDEIYFNGTASDVEQKCVFSDTKTLS